MRRIRDQVLWRAVVFALGAAPLGATVGAAQAPGLREVGTSGTWGTGGLGLALGLPVGEFRNFVSVAGGVGGAFAVHLDRRGTLGLRIEASYLQYGNERRLLPLAGTDGLLNLALNTTFYIAALRVGPEVVLGDGRVRPYAFGTIGGAYFATETSLGDGGCGCRGLARTTNYDDGALSLAAGGGLRIELSRGRHPLALDLGAAYVSNGPVSYLHEGSIVQNPDGSFTLLPVRSRADLVALQLGVSVGLR